MARHRTHAVVAGVLGILVSSAAQASTVLVPASASTSGATGAVPGTPTVIESRLAFAASPSRTVVWEQLVVAPSSVDSSAASDAGNTDEADAGADATGDGARGGASIGSLVWLVAVPDGGRVEVASGAWLDALDLASAPRLTAAPEIACTDTSQSTSTVDLNDGQPSLGITSVVDLVGLSAGEAGDRLASAGLVVDDALRAELATLAGNGEHVVAFQLSSNGLSSGLSNGGTTGSTFVTPAVRVIGPAARAIPTTLAPVVSVPMRLFFIAPTRIGFDDVDVPNLDFSAIAWNTAGTTSYLGVLAGTPGGLAVTFASRDALFFDTTGVDADDPIPSVARSYLGNAIAGDATEAAACTAQVAAFGFSSVVVVPTCPRGVLIDESPSEPTATPCEEAAQGDLSPSALACGARDDLAVALGGLQVGTSWVTRIETTTLWLAQAAGATAHAIDPHDDPHDDAHDGTLAAVHAVGSSAIPCPGAPTSSTSPASSDTPPSSDSTSAATAADAAATGCSAGSSAADGCDSSDSEGSAGSGCDGDASDSSDASACSGSSDSGSCSVHRRGRVRASPFGYGLLILLAWTRRTRRTHRTRRQAPPAPSH